MPILEKNLNSPFEMHINRIPLKKTASKQIKASMKMVKDVQSFCKVRDAPYAEQVVRTDTLQKVEIAVNEKGKTIARADTLQKSEKKLSVDL